WNSCDDGRKVMEYEKSSRREDGMKTLGKTVTGLALMGISAALLVLPQFAATQSRQPMPGIDQSGSGSAEPVPAFHAQPPTGELPPTMEPSLYTDKVVFNAYVIAGRSKKVLYQQPCYCHCDRSHGHGSLLDCFVGRHGSGCDTCMKEAFYSYEQTHKGKTPAQIREAIIRGDWQKVDVAKYQKDYLPPLGK
ncbi:MAG: CYCXC family (seleno)protein, partial [Candidatus Acidiferrum sp.]